MVHTIQTAQRIIGQLECRANCPFVLVGSVAIRGESAHDIDLLWDSKHDMGDCGIGSREQFECILADMGFECINMSNEENLETWQRGDGLTVDFWF